MQQQILSSLTFTYRRKVERIGMFSGEPAATQEESAVVVFASLWHYPSMHGIFCSFKLFLSSTAVGIHPKEEMVAIPSGTHPLRGSGWNTLKQRSDTLKAMHYHSLSEIINEAKLGERDCFAQWCPENFMNHCWCNCSGSETEHPQMVSPQDGQAAGPTAVLSCMGTGLQLYKLLPCVLSFCLKQCCIFRVVGNAGYFSKCSWKVSFL